LQWEVIHLINLFGFMTVLTIFNIILTIKLVVMRIYPMIVLT
jgi:hypothetical protein